MCSLRSILLIQCLLFSSLSFAEVQVLFEENFDSGELKKIPGWGVGYQAGGFVGVSTDPKEVLGNKGGSLKATYPKANGGIYGWAGFDMKPYDTYEVYVEFHAKMPKAKEGIKFLKIFGGANTTFGLDYTGISTGKGSMYQVSFGDGTTTQNDTQNVINFNSAHPQWIGRSYGTAVVETPEKKGWTAEDWGDSWHHFRFKIKFNSVETTGGVIKEIHDGAYYVEIDGKVFVNATGLLNRHPSNEPIRKVAFLDWSQNISEPFEIWYDNIRITLGGFDESNRPVTTKAIIK
jgi:hypothetical protein